MILTISVQPRQVGRSILVFKKDIAASVATLGDMMRQARDNGSCNPWHIRLLDLLSMRIKVDSNVLPVLEEAAQDGEDLMGDLTKCVPI